MSDMMDTLKGLLGDNADEKLDGIMKIINPDGAPEGNTPVPGSTGEITPEMLGMMQSLMGRLNNPQGDDRTNLLQSLKPYMDKTRQGTIDSAIKMLKLSQLGDVFKEVL